MRIVTPAPESRKGAEQMLMWCAGRLVLRLRAVHCLLSYRD